MTVKRYRVFLASDVQKEEDWLTEMSAEGLHFRKNRLGMYYFDEDPNKQYVYQIDFQQGVDKAYFQLYEDAGWESVDEFMRMFHYFRRDANAPGAEKLYSDAESMKDSFQRMMRFYTAIFIFFVLASLPNLFYQKEFLLQKILVVVDVIIVIVYIYIFIGLRRKIRSYHHK